MSPATQTLRIGLIGFGQWGPNHARNFNGIAGTKVLRICDLSEKRRHIAQELFVDAHITASPEEIISADNIDAVVVATPVRAGLGQRDLGVATSLQSQRFLRQ